MRIKTLLAIGGACIAFAANPAAAQITGVDAMKEWNLIVLGDLQSSSEVEGRTFVGGNLSGTSSNYNIKDAAKSQFGTPGLTVVGNVDGGHKNLERGSGAVVGGNVNSGFNLNGSPQTVKVGGTISNTNVNQNTVQSGLGSSDPAFRVGLEQQKSLLTSSLSSLSTDMKGMDSNSQFTISGNRGTFTAQPDAKGVAVFNISSADLDKIGEIQFNLNGADTAIVNVSGTKINLNDNFLGSGTKGLGEHVIWNFPDATEIKSTTAWGGSVLAPNAAANTANYIEGSAVFGSLVQNGEFHLGTYIGGYTPPSTPPTGGETPTPVPEEALGLFAAGALGLLWVRRRRKRLAAA